MAIAKKTALAHTTATLARKLKRLIAKSDEICRLGAKVDIQPIKNPARFVKMMKEAYEISQFKFTFRRPNPFDTEEHLLKPLKGALQEIQGEKGELRFDGNELDRDKVSKLVGATAATGDTATARLRMKKGAKRIWASSRQDDWEVSVDEPSTTDGKMSLLQLVRGIYREVRDGNGRHNH